MVTTTIYQDLGIDLTPIPENRLTDAEAYELREYVKYHEGNPHWAIHVNYARLRLLRHHHEVIKAAIVIKETSFIYLEDLEAVAKDVHYYGIENDPGPPLTDAELAYHGVDVEEYHKWDHVGGVRATNHRAICELFGHDIEDCSSAGPDSGNMDHRCKRCGEYWAVTLY